MVGRVEIFALEGDKLVLKVEELVSAPLIEAGVEGLFFVELVVVPATCLVGFRGSFLNVLKMMTWLYRFSILRQPIIGRTSIKLLYR